MAATTGRGELDRHLTAEKRVSEYLARQGTILKCVSTYDRNRWLNAGCAALFLAIDPVAGQYSESTFVVPARARRG